MARKRYTAEEAAEVLMADDDPDQASLDASIDSDDSLSAQDLDQAVLPDSDSDAIVASESSSESDTEGEEESDIHVSNDAYYVTKDADVKWRKNVPSQRGRPSGINAVDGNRIGPSQLVPQSFESPLEAFQLTQPDDCINTLIGFTNQKYEEYCRQNPRGSATYRLRGCRPFSKEGVLACHNLFHRALNPH